MKIIETVIRSCLTTLLVLVLVACSSDAIKRSSYEALYQKECLDRTGTMNCDPEHKNYDTYNTQRDDAMKRD